MDYAVKSRIWLEVDGKAMMGQGRLQLLKAIEDTGSLSKAAKSLGMSYKKAWKLIDSVNQHAKSQVVATSVGGKGGGGAHLTPYGKKLVEAFEKLNQECWDFLDAKMQQFNNL